MQVRIEGIPITLEWSGGNPSFKYPNGASQDARIAEALQFEILAKLDNLERALKERKDEVL